MSLWQKQLTYLTRYKPNRKNVLGAIKSDVTGDTKTQVSTTRGSSESKVQKKPLYDDDYL